MELGLKEVMFGVIIGLSAFSIGFMSGSDTKVSEIISKCNTSPNMVSLNYKIYRCYKYVDTKKE